jgi:hypothetical protein
VNSYLLYARAKLLGNSGVPVCAQKMNKHFN